MLGPNWTVHSDQGVELRCKREEYSDYCAYDSSAYCRSVRSMMRLSVLYEYEHRWYEQVCPKPKILQMQGFQVSGLGLKV